MALAAVRKTEDIFQRTAFRKHYECGVGLVKVTAAGCKNSPYFRQQSVW